MVVDLSFFSFSFFSALLLYAIVVGCHCRLWRERREKKHERISCNVYDTLSKYPNVTFRLHLTPSHQLKPLRICVTLTKLDWAHTFRAFLASSIFFAPFLFCTYYFFFFISSQSLCRSVIFLHKFDRTVKLTGYFRIKKTFIVILQRMKMA